MDLGAFHDAIGPWLTGVGLLLLLVAALHDVALRSVPNWLALALLAVGLALRLADGGGALIWGGLAAFAILLITFIFWRLEWMGGGDVKLLTAAALFVKPMLIPMLISGTAIAGGVLALIYLVASFVVKRPLGGKPKTKLGRLLRCEQWRLHRRGPLPYAAAIAAGGFIATLHA